MVVGDGGTIHNPPGFTDVNSAFITLPDGRVFEKKHLPEARPLGPDRPERLAALVTPSFKYHP